MTVEELANRIAALRVSLDERIEAAKANDAEVRKHIARLSEMGIEVEPRNFRDRERVDYYSNVWWEFEKGAREMLYDFFRLAEKLPPKGSTEIVLGRAKPATVEPSLRPGYDIVPTARKR